MSPEVLRFFARRSLAVSTVVKAVVVVVCVVVMSWESGDGFALDLGEVVSFCLAIILRSRRFTAAIIIIIILNLAGFGQNPKCEVMDILCQKWPSKPSHFCNVT